MITLSPRFAENSINKYWVNSSEWTGNDENYSMNIFMTIKKILNADKKQKILDYGCGKADIAEKFKKEGFDITCCDISDKYVLSAQEQGLDSYSCKEIIERGKKFDKIYMNNGFFYVHPKKYIKFLSGINGILNENGELYLLTVATFDKRSYYHKGISKIITRFFPVYQVHIGGFFVKDKILKKSAIKAGFKFIDRIKEEESDARTNFILRK